MPLARGCFLHPEALGKSVSLRIGGGEITDDLPVSDHSPGFRDLEGASVSALQTIAELGGEETNGVLTPFVRGWLAAVRPM